MGPFRVVIIDAESMRSRPQQLSSIEVDGVPDACPGSGRLVYPPGGGGRERYVVRRSNQTCDQSMLPASPRKRRAVFERQGGCRWGQSYSTVLGSIRRGFSDTSVGRTSRLLVKGEPSKAECDRVRSSPSGETKRVFRRCRENCCAPEEIDQASTGRDEECGDRGRSSSEGRVDIHRSRPRRAAPRTLFGVWTFLSRTR